MTLAVTTEERLIRGELEMKEEEGSEAISTETRRVIFKGGWSSFTEASPPVVCSNTGGNSV